MFNKLITIITATILTLSATDSALAAFADMELIRVYYDRAGAEYGTDLGNIDTILAAPTTTVTGSFTGANGIATFAAYFALDRTTNKLWVSGVNDAAVTWSPAIIGGSTGLTSIKSGTTNMYNTYNLQGGTDYAGLASHPNSYKNKIAATAGWFANTVTAANSARTFGELSLANLATSNTQYLWYWPNGLATDAASKTGVAVAQITTNLDGSTTIDKLPIISGTCGNAAGQPLLVAPTSNLCSSGTPLAVTGNGPWNWICNGQDIDANGVTGTNAACATSTIHFISPTIVPNGTIKCDSPVIPGGTSVCTITPGVGAQLVTLTDNTDDVTASVVGNSYTITNIQANHTIDGTFVADTTPPVVTINTAAPITSTSATVNIAFTATDEVGVDGYLLNETPTQPTDLITGWTAVSPAVTGFSGNASKNFSTVDPGASSIKTLYMWAKDAAGNVSNPDPLALIQLTILKPALITGLAPPADPYFLLLQSAFDTVADNDTIQVITSTLAENPLTFNRPAVTATLRGGYDALPSGTVTGVTTIQGRLNIRDGKLIVSGVAIKSTL